MHNGEKISTDDDDDTGGDDDGGEGSQVNAELTVAEGATETRAALQSVLLDVDGYAWRESGNQQARAAEHARGQERPQGQPAEMEGEVVLPDETTEDGEGVGAILIRGRL